jgi:hypothetical protein
LLSLFPRTQGVDPEHMSHLLRTSVDDLIQGLKSFERELITNELVRQYVEPGG